MRIILASASPRRRDLIQKINNVEIIVRPSLCEEWTVKTIPYEVVMDLSLLKARDIAKDYPDDIVLGADTIVTLNGKIFGKPKNRVEAKEFLKELSGKSHEVLTGVTLIKGNHITTFYESTIVTILPFDEKKIDAYVKTGKPLDKAGAYGYQDEEFASLVEKIDGDKDNVIGLPVARIIEELRKNYDY